MNRYSVTIHVAAESPEGAAQAVVAKGLDIVPYVRVTQDGTGEAWDVDTKDWQSFADDGDDWLEWPVEPGFYWFYGYIHGEFAKRFREGPEITPVVAVGNDQIHVHYYADFVYRHTSRGRFKKASGPFIPKELTELVGDYSKDGE